MMRPTPAPLARLRELAADLVQDHRGIPYDVIARIDEIAATLDRERAEPTDVLNAAYRERSALVAGLIRVGGFRAEVVMAPDTEGWWIVYVETPAGQLSWHIAPDDMDLFSDWPVAFGSRPSPWDGHTTEEKYERLARLAAIPVAKVPKP